jgi:hypothetical protein
MTSCVLFDKGLSVFIEVCHLFMIVHTVGQIMRGKCFLKHVIEGTLEGGIEATGIRGRKNKQLLDNLKETRGYWKLKKEALHRSVWRIGFCSGCGFVVRQTMERINND